MEKDKEKARDWIEPGIVIAVVLFAVGAQTVAMTSLIGGVNSRIDGTNSRIDGMNSRIDSVNSRIDSLERVLSGQNLEIKHTDKKIDDLKNSLLSRPK